MLLYVDDIILTSSSMVLLHCTISALQQEFMMRDLGPLHHFLGITVERCLDGMFLHQRTYMLDIIKRAGMADCKSCTTPVDLQMKLATNYGPPVQDASQFQSIAGALHYLTFTRPDIAYTVQQICLHIHDPQEPHLVAMKCILCYLQGRHTTVFFYIIRAALTLLSTQTLTGSIVQMHAALRSAM
jgi:hypothetical protein